MIGGFSLSTRHAFTDQASILGRLAVPPSRASLARESLSHRSRTADLAGLRREECTSHQDRAQRKSRKRNRANRGLEGAVKTLFAQACPSHFQIPVFFTLNSVRVGVCLLRPKQTGRRICRQRCSRSLVTGGANNSRASQFHLRADATGPVREVIAHCAND